MFIFEISEAGTYEISVSDGPAEVGIWSVMSDGGQVHSEHSRDDPMESAMYELEPGTYYAEVGTPYLSVGNTGSYTVSLEEVADDGEAAAAA